jgi:hypothetical protein
MKPLYEAIYTALLARDNCRTPGFARPEMAHTWDESLAHLATKLLPRGAGFDCGTRILGRTQNGSGFILETEFHHMDDNGFYDGWTEHRITVRPSFVGGFDLTISGQNRDDVKGYIAEVFNAALMRPVDLNAVLGPLMGLRDPTPTSTTEDA